MSEVVLSNGGAVNTYSIFSVMRQPVGFILLDMSGVFAQVMHRMGLDYRLVLAQQYADTKS